MRIRFIIFFLALADLYLCAQPGVNSEYLKEKYQKYNAVVTKQEFDYVFDIVDDTVQVKQHNTKEIFILTDHLKVFTNDYIYYGSFSSVEDVEASTFIPRGKSYEKIKVTRFNETHDRGGSIFYDDARTMRFSYPSITEGAVTSLHYSVLFHNPRFINKSYFQSFIPVLSARVVVKVNKDIRIGYKILNDDNINIDFKSYSKGKYNYYEWEAKDVSPSKYVSTDYFNILHYGPHMALYLEEVKIGGKTEKYYSTLDDLYRFYYELISGMDNTASDELKDFVEKLTNGLPDREKAKAIYYWVQDNIKYVAYSDGYQGFIPAPPSEVFAKRYGDCKGMSGLIGKMMNLAGLEAYLSWVGTRDLPYGYNEFPLPAVDNHMVISYIEGDTTFIVDGTFKHLDFGLYPFHIQGKEVLIGIDSTEYRVFEVPVSDASLSTIADSVTISLSGNTITGSGKRIHTGFNKVELASAIDGVKEKDYKKKFSTLFEKGNNKFRIDSVRTEALFDHDKPAAVYYDFTLEDYAKTVGNEIFINLNLDKPFQDMKVDTTRQYSPVVNDYFFTRRSVTSFKIPQGYEVAYLPENSFFACSDYNMSFTYSVQDDHISLDQKMTLNFLIIKDSGLNQWDSAIDWLNNNYRMTLVLRKTE